jgi:hypothetical protein
VGQVALAVMLLAESQLSKKAKSSRLLLGLMALTVGTLRLEMPVMAVDMMGEQGVAARVSSALAIIPQLWLQLVAAVAVELGEHTLVQVDISLKKPVVAAVDPLVVPVGMVLKKMVETPVGVVLEVTAAMAQGTAQGEAMVATVELLSSILLNPQKRDS